MMYRLNMKCYDICRLATQTACAHRARVLLLLKFDLQLFKHRKLRQVTQRNICTWVRFSKVKSFIFKIVAKDSRDISSTNGDEKKNYVGHTEHRLLQGMNAFLFCSKFLLTHPPDSIRCSAWRGEKPFTKSLWKITFSCHTATECLSFYHHGKYLHYNLDPYSSLKVMLLYW